MELRLEHFKPTPLLQQLLPPSMARLYGALPLDFKNARLTIAFTKSPRSEVLEELRFVLGCDVYEKVLPYHAVMECLRRYTASEVFSDKEPFSLMKQGDVEDAGVVFQQEDLLRGDTKDQSSEEFLLQYAHSLLRRAVAIQASDLHIEVCDQECSIRYRKDGVLRRDSSLELQLASSLISCFKVMAHLDIAEQRLPQDGRFSFLIDGREVTFRISSLPTQFGESLVLRLLDDQNSSLTAGLIPKKVEEKIFQILQKPHGLFIVTGPTGSGKTTTLAHCLRFLHEENRKLLTVEDPIEYVIDGVMQVSINDALGLSFEKMLRSFLRQDPDVIMIGEVRDAPTAKMVMQAALTGHRVLTTLHTRGAIGAIARLVDMKIQPLMIAAALEGVVAQRLVRKICPSCREPDSPRQELIAQLGISQEDLGYQKIFYGRGCSACQQTGYLGREAIFEVLVMNDSLRYLIAQKASYDVLRKAALEQGMRTLRDDALRLLFEGVTTVEEVLKQVVGEGKTGCREQLFRVQETISK